VIVKRVESLSKFRQLPFEANSNEHAAKRRNVAITDSLPVSEGSSHRINLTGPQLKGLPDPERVKDTILAKVGNF
jgi:hypothetical protein